MSKVKEPKPMKPTKPIARQNKRAPIQFGPLCRKYLFGQVRGGMPARSRRGRGRTGAAQ